MIVGKNAPYFTTTAFINEDIKTITLEDYKGKWLVVFFYSGDFTFV